MAIKSKNSGAYADIVGVSVKTAGTYAAVQGIYAKSGGSYESVFSGISEKTFSVTLSGITGATPSSISVIVTIQDNPIIIQLNTTRITGKAPLAVGFDASGTVSSLTTNPDHDLWYAWDFGDEQGETFAYGATSGQNMNVGYGNIGAHVYKTEGTYSPKVTVMDGYGNITVYDLPAVTVSAWALADTIYISNGSTPTAGVNGVPTGAGGYYNETTWAGVVSRWSANKRIMLDRASTWACVGNTNLISGLEINAYGSGTKPTITSAGASMCPFSTSSGVSDVRVVGIKHNGPGEGITDSGMITLNNTASTNVLMLDCESNGSTFGMLSGISCNEIFIQNSYLHGYTVTPGSGISTNLAIYLTDTYGVYILGCDMADSASHLVRLAGAQRLLFDSNRLRNCDVNAVGRDAFTLRGFDNTANVALWSGIYTEKCVISNNDIDMSAVPTSQYVLQSKPTNTGIFAKFRKILVERNFVATPGEPFNFQCQEQFTFRNNIGRSTGASPTSAATGVSLGNSSVVGSPNPTNCNFYNNTFYMGGTIYNYSAIAFDSTVSNSEVKNNLAYAPNQANAVLVKIGGATGVTASSNSTDTQVRSVKPWTSAAPLAAADFSPNGSYAVGGGETLVNVLEDFYKAPLTGARGIGAIKA